MSNYLAIKKNFFNALFIILVFFALFLFQPTAAQEDLGPTFDQQLEAFAGKEGVGLDKPIDPRIVAAQIIRIFISVIGLLFLLYAVYAGYLIMSAAGDEEKIKKGKSTLRTAIIGVFVALSSYGLLYLVSEIALRSASARRAHPPPSFLPWGGS